MKHSSVSFLELLFNIIITRLDLLALCSILNYIIYLICSNFEKETDIQNKRKNYKYKCGF